MRIAIDRGATAVHREAYVTLFFGDPVLRPALTGLKVLLHSIRAHDRHRLIVILRLTDGPQSPPCAPCLDAHARIHRWLSNRLSLW